MRFKSISPRELREKLDAGENFRLVDVREPLEFELARLERTELLPLSEFAAWHEQINDNENTVFICHHGVRSAHVCAYFA